ncbi:MAG: hypothetical protein U9R11_01840 [Chloroflexota bacterium]|nr:hypothetical protein [Chloroflexota bacterium]
MICKRDETEDIPYIAHGAGAVFRPRLLVDLKGSEAAPTPIGKIKRGLERHPTPVLFSPAFKGNKRDGYN